MSEDYNLKLVGNYDSELLTAYVRYDSTYSNTIYSTEITGNIRNISNYTWTTQRTFTKYKSLVFFLSMSFYVRMCYLTGNTVNRVDKIVTSGAPNVIACGNN